VAAAILAAACLGVSAFPFQPARAEATVKIGGTGAALEAMRLAGARLAEIAPGTRVEVLPSLGTSGSKRALLDGAIQIAVVQALDALKPAETEAGMREAACFTTAMVLASSHRDPRGVERARLPGIYADPDPRWWDGTPLKIVLRSRAGSENPYFARAVPGMGEALEAAYRRPGIPIAATDQENAEVARLVPGSFAMATLLQIKAERLALKPLAVDGVEPSAETVASGAYPFPLRLCLLVRGEPGPGAGSFVSYLRSPAGAALMRSIGATPAP
jgi:phosphate transport system substrate-binding protein